ncbi:MAG: hemerythrin domain-containing protein [Paludibacteraceae bacterium]|nr:hemerythrin domain-containing protein [Paludibacteraceae bacterium]
MFSNHKFNERSRMGEIIHEDTSLLLTISRFGISLGFGDKTVQEACDANEIHCKTFLAVVNFIAEGNVMVQETYEHISIESVINYLKNAHHYFLSYKLPSIREKLIEAVESSGQSGPYKVVFMKFFDEYFQEVRKHMDYEDKTVFPYVMRLLSGKPDKKYRIAYFEEHHSDVDSKLSELKSIIVRYYPSKGQNYKMNDVLFDLYACEKDLALHNMIEDFFFVPVVEAIEEKSKKA